jgi:hypothetical protein
MPTATTHRPARTRRPRIVAFLLADDERRTNYVAGARTSNGVEHDVVPGPVLPVPLIIAARFGLLLVGFVAVLAMVASVTVSVSIWIGA